MVKTVYVTGYKSFELNIFKDDAPEVHYLKQFIKHKIEQLLDEGLEWVLIQEIGRASCRERVYVLV